LLPSPSLAPDGASESAELVIENRLQDLARVSAAIDDLAARRGIPQDAAFDMNVALDEVLANLISHAYTDDAVHTIHLAMIATPAALEVQVRDDGVPFDPLAAPTPDLQAPLEDRPIGGLGIHLVRSLMNEVQYQREGGYNTLRIVRRFA
jgi:anti-sigma regulatory factor (Ser/Thr protein kinase)